MNEDDKNPPWTGTPLGDSWYGDEKIDTLSGGGGDDTLRGSEYDDEVDDLGDTLKGDAGNDTLLGYYGDDLLEGGTGNDKLYGGFGYDKLYGGTGNDILSGGLVENYSTGDIGPAKPVTGKGDYIDGGANTDTVEINYDVIVRETGKPFNVSFAFSSSFAVKLGDGRAEYYGETVVNCEILHYHGGDGANNVTGGAGDDIISGGTGVDTLDGGAGDDVIIDRGGHFTLKGGADSDTLQLTQFGTKAMVLSGDAGTFKNGSDTSTFSGFESIQLITGSGADKLTGLSKGANKLSAGDGNDVVTGGKLADELIGGKGSDILHGGDGGDRLRGSYDAINASESGRDQVYGEGGNDTIEVSDIQRITKGSVFDGGAGTDKLVLYLDNERGWLSGPTISDLTKSTFSGFEAVTIDTPSTYSYTVKFSTAQFAQFDEITAYRPAFSTVAAIEFADDAKVSLAGKTLRLDAFQLASGGQTLDLTGAKFEERLNPKITGGTGADVVTASANKLVSVSFSGGAGNDKMVAGSSPASFGGGEGDDLMVGGSGRSGFSGGAGIDTMSYSAASKAVTASLATPALNAGDAAGDTYTLVENLKGSGASDTLYGDGADNTLWGGLGNDKLSGDAGADTLKGEDGSDTLSGAAGLDALFGGKGKDTFLFADALSTGKSRDTVADFSLADGDRIGLSNDLFARTLKADTSGHLTASQFGALGKADSNDRILYDAKKGDLYFDKDGSDTKGSDPVLFAHLDALKGKFAALDAGDFVIV
jgi:Ca2+-binding RTX toxin-like protein